MEDGRIRLMGRDDGVGGADPANGSGLTGLTDRVEALGGTITVFSLPGTGTSPARLTAYRDTGQGVLALAVATDMRLIHQFSGMMDKCAST